MAAVPQRVVFGDFEQVAETAQIYEAELMALKLRAEGLDAQVVDQTFRQEPMPNVRAMSVVRVLVPLAEAGLARELLAQAQPLPDDAELPVPDEGPDGSS